MTTTLSSREFNQDCSRAKKATLQGPVFITNRGKAEHVLLSIKDYQQLTGLASAPLSLADSLAQHDAADVDFEPRRADFSLRPVDLS